MTTNEEQREVADLQVSLAEAFEQQGVTLSQAHCQLLATQAVGARKYMRAYLGELPVSLVQGFCTLGGHVEVDHDPDGKITVDLVDIEVDGDAAVEITESDYPTTSAFPQAVEGQTSSGSEGRMEAFMKKQLTDPVFPPHIPERLDPEDVDDPRHLYFNGQEVEVNTPQGAMPVIVRHPSSMPQFT